MGQDTNSLDDATLVQYVVAGKREAFTPLLLRYYTSVQKLCSRILHSTWEAEDVAQEAALQAFLGIRRLRDPTRFGAWFHAIAANLARRTLNRQRHRANIPYDEPDSALWNKDLLTPESVLAAHEIHEIILSALGNLSSVNREIAVGYYLQGYRYDELAGLLHVPASTVRGRLFQARRHLRQSLSAINPTHAPIREQQKESIMKETELVEMQRSRFLFPFTPDGFASRTAIELRSLLSEQGFALYINHAEGEALAGLSNWSNDDRLANANSRIVLQGLTQSLMSGLGIQVKRVIVKRLVNSTFYATVELRQGKKEISVDARPGEALILASYTGAPIFTARSVVNSIGYNWADLISHITEPQKLKTRDPQAYDAIRSRIAERIGKDTNPPTVAPFEHQVPRHIEDLLKRLLDNSKGQTAFLVDHRTGTLVAWCGSGNEHTLQLFSRICGCRAQSPQDLRDLLLYSHFLIGEIAQGAQMPFAQIGLYWQVNLVLPSDCEPSDVSNVISQTYYAETIKELSKLCETETSIDKST